MEQLRDYTDDRLFSGCVYCGGPAETVDHVPSRVLLDQPFPENLPVVAACSDCNSGFSRDEEYFACIIESVIAGTTDPDKIERARIAASLRRSPKLRSMIDAARFESDGVTGFSVDSTRIENVLLKLARGHAAFELSTMARTAPSHFGWAPLGSLPQKQREAFEEPEFPEVWGEVGSRSMQRIAIAQVVLRSAAGEQINLNIAMNDWIDVQPDRYRYWTSTTGGGMKIRFVIREYLACEVYWLE